MGSIDTRLHDLEGKVRALVTSYLHHGSRLSEQQDEIDELADAIAASPSTDYVNMRLDELQARVAALEWWKSFHIEQRHAGEAGGPEPAAGGGVVPQPCAAASPNQQPRDSRPAPAQAACPHPHCIMQCCPLHPEQAAQPAPQQPRGGGG